MWIEKLVKVNPVTRPGTKLKGVRKIINHYTANPGASAYNHYKYFNGTAIAQKRYASAHIFVDKTEAYLIIPLNEVAYHANDGSYRGVPELKPNANLYSIGIELCIEKDGTFHPETLRRAAEINAELCKRFKLDPHKDIVRHYDVTHKNCPARWVKYPKEFTVFKNMVAHVMNPPKKPKEEDDMLDKAILIGGFPDFAVAEVLAGRIKAPIYTREAYPGGKVTKELYVVGGSTAGLQADKVINLTGKDRFAVAAAVDKFLK